MLLILQFKKKVNAMNCGIQSASGMTHGGKMVYNRKEHPWKAALMKLNRENQLQYFCGGVLIDEKRVLTGNLYSLLSINFNNTV